MTAPPGHCQLSNAQGISETTQSLKGGSTVLRAKPASLVIKNAFHTPAQACDKYRAAWNLKQSSHSALYNWGVALSDMSRVLKTTDRATANGLLTEAAEKYATSLQWNANNPQVMDSARHAKELSAKPGTDLRIHLWNAVTQLDADLACQAWQAVNVSFR